jgi:hypothetical protein
LDSRGAEENNGVVNVVLAKTRRRLEKLGKHPHNPGIGAIEEVEVLVSLLRF